MREVAGNQAADPLGATVISIVVASREHVGPEHHSTFHFRAEERSGPFVKLLQALGFWRARAVTNAVESSQIRRGLRRGNDIVGWDRVGRARKRHLANLRAQRLEST